MAMRHGAVDYLLKPAKREELKRVLYEVESRVIERNLHKNTGTYLRRRNTFK